jgi:hypothetical protein
MMLPIRNILFALSILIFIVLVVLFWNYSIDDAFITFRYAENFANGLGLVFNPGDKPVEGYSNFLWLLILSLLYKIGLPVYISAKVLGVIFFISAASVWFNHFRIRLRWIDKYYWLSPIIFMITPVTAFWAVSGLELGLNAFLVAYALILVIKNKYWSMLFLAMLVLNRPEGFLVAIAIVLIDFLIRKISGEKRTKHFLANLGAILAIMVIIVIFRLIIFGHPLPNTFYMKSQLTISALLELAKLALYFLPMTILFIWRIWNYLKTKAGDGFIFFGLIFLIQGMISIMALPVMNFNFRYLVSFMPIFFAVALGAIDNLRYSGLKRLILPIMFIFAFISIVPVYSTIRNEEKIMQAQNDFLSWVEPLPQSAKISITDTGRIPYYSGKYFYDIWGLTSEEIAQTGFNPLREYWRFPDYFVFIGYLEKEVVKLRFGTERLIYQCMGFQQVYPLVGAAKPQGASAFSPGYYYLVFRKDQKALDSLLKEHPIK